jgi:deoxyxylulose-5-phosphate synthase
LIADRQIGPVTIIRMGIPDQFIEHGAVSVLRKKYGLDADGIAAKVRQMVTDNAQVDATHGQPVVAMAAKSSNSIR